MNEIIEKDIEFMYTDLQKRGLTEENLLIEMIDHICCIIEPFIKAGNTFNNAYYKTIDSLDNDIFENIQHETNLLTNLKLQKMKKSMYISGVFGTLIMFTGIIFKLNHWPGASISILFGALFLILIFLPLFFFVSHTEQKEKKSILFPLVGYLTISFLILGPLFKVMHWPGANSLLLFGPMFLALIFLPIYLVQVFKKSKETKTNFTAILIIVGIGITSFLMLARTGPSFETLTKYNSMYEKNMKVYKMVYEKNSILLADMSNDSIKNNDEYLNKITNYSNEIHHFIDSLSTMIIIDSDKDEFVQGKIENISKTRIFRRYIKENNNGEKLKKMINNFQTYLINNSKDEIQKHIINQYFNIVYMRKSDNFVRYYDITTIDGLYMLSEIDLNIELAKHEILKK